MQALNKAYELGLLIFGVSSSSPEKGPMLPYSITEHKHRFSAWTASLAAGVKRGRFTVEHGKTILDRSGLRDLIEPKQRRPYEKEQPRAIFKSLVSLLLLGHIINYGQINILIRYKAI
jgi:hypothetical protein